MVQPHVALILLKALSSWPVSVSPGFMKNGAVLCRMGCGSEYRASLKTDLFLASSLPFSSREG